MYQMRQFLIPRSKCTAIIIISILKQLFFLYKIEQKNTPKHINCHIFSIIFRRAYVRHSKYIDTIYTDLFNIKNINTNI